MSVLAGLVAGLIVATPVSIIVLLVGLCLRRPWSEVVSEVGKFAIEITLDGIFHGL